MRRAFALAPIAFVAFLPACMAQESPADPPEDACGASGYSDLVGKNLAAVTLPQDLNARVIKPGDIVTQDFVPDRLNIETNELGVIENLRCG